MVQYRRAQRMRVLAGNGASSANGHVALRSPLARRYVGEFGVVQSRDVQFVQPKPLPLQRKLRVLVVAINYAPDLVGCAKYNTELAEGLTALGHEVEVVTAPPYYPDWKIGNGYSGAWWRRERRNGVKVHRVPLYVPKKPSGLKRLLHLASFGCASLFSTMHIASRFKPDVIFAVAPALTSAVAALAGALVCNAKTWLHIQDWEVEAAFDLGLLKGAGSRKMALGVEGSLLRSFDRVSSIGPAMVQKIIEKGVASTRVFELRNWVDVDQTCVFESSNTRYRKELNISADEIVALYSGNMARKQGLEALADVARRLEAIKAPVTMVLCGAGPARADLESLCADLSNVKWLPLQSLDRLPELLGTADIHLLPQRAEAADLVLPSKLTGMLASGRPVLAMAEEGSGLAQEVKDCGVIVSADSQAMSDAILELAADAKTRARLGANARARAIDRWCRRTIIAEFSQSLYAKRPSISPNVGAHQSV